MTYNLYSGCRQAFSPCQFKKINEVLLSCRSYLCYTRADRYFASTTPGDPNSPYQEICVGDPAPTFSAIFPNSNSPSFNWYAEESSSTPLLAGTATFTPTLGTGTGQLDNMTPGTYSFFMEDVNSYGGCKMKVEVVVRPSAGPGSSAGGVDSLSLCGQSNLLLEAPVAQFGNDEIIGWWISNNPLNFSSQTDLDNQLANVTLGGSLNSGNLNHLFPAVQNKKKSDAACQLQPADSRAAILCYAHHFQR